jgi:hypothetical protein
MLFFGIQQILAECCDIDTSIAQAPLRSLMAAVPVFPMMFTFDAESCPKVLVWVPSRPANE